MDAKSELREFLTSRRARITPEQAGLRTYGGSRRVPGLRREEVALLAGVSVDYYTRLERGNAGGASESVLDSLARALQLDDVERTHLFHLARASQPSTRTPRSGTASVRASVQTLLDAMTGAPGFVRNGRLDILGANMLGRALYAPHLEDRRRPPNTARFVFLDPRSREFYVDWDDVAHDVVAILHAEAGKNPYDKGLSDLVGELSTQSELFRTRWAAHNVRRHGTGRKRFRHPIVGDLELTYDTMTLVADVDLFMFVYTADAGSKSEEALRLLASWAATLEQEEIESGDHEKQPGHLAGAE